MRESNIAFSTIKFGKTFGACSIVVRQNIIFAPVVNVLRLTLHSACCGDNALLFSFSLIQLQAVWDLDSGQTNEWQNETYY